MEQNAHKTNCFLILLIFGVPTAAVRARQDRLGPSIRPCLKGYPKMEQNAYETNGVLEFC